MIRAAQPVKVEVTFLQHGGLGRVELEWFVDSINSTAETRATISMTALGNGRYAVATRSPARSIVRSCGGGSRPSGGRAWKSSRRVPDDPQIAAIGIGGAREAWHGYFVEPVRSVLEAHLRLLHLQRQRCDPRHQRRARALAVCWRPATRAMIPRTATIRRMRITIRSTTPRPVLRIGMASCRRSLSAAAWCTTSSRVTTGSRYQRSAGKNSWKFSFPAYRLMDGKQRILVTEKDNRTILGLALFREAGLPAGYAQFVDFYKNGNGVTQRCEISDADEETVAQYQREQEEANPQTPPVYNGLGIIYKSKGLDGNEGPFGWANGQPMPASGQWSSLDRYIHSFPSQLNDWRGGVPMKTMVDQLWAARGDLSQISYSNRYAGQDHNNQTNVAVNLTSLRAHLNANWDVDKMLSYLAIRNWSSPWDDKFHNHYVYLQPDNRWTMVPWDFDGEMSGGATGDQGYTNSIFAGRKNDLAGNYSNNSRGPNWFKDSVLRAFEAEYRQRMFILNNTLLSPANIQAVAAANGVSVPDLGWVNNRFDEHQYAGESRGLAGADQAGESHSHREFRSCASGELHHVRLRPQQRRRDGRKRPRKDALGDPPCGPHVPSSGL